MIHIKRTNSTDSDFKRLVALLDEDLSKRDGEDHTFYAQFNKIDRLNHAVVAYEAEQAIGCGAIKDFQDEAMEVKRMFVIPESRGKGVATRILAELEQWAAELFYKTCVLETGKRQPEAIELYKKNGYIIISNYGPYENVENSVCFRKKIAVD